MEGHWIPYPREAASFASISKFNSAFRIAYTCLLLAFPLNWFCNILLMVRKNWEDSKGRTVLNFQLGRGIEPNFVWPFRSELHLHWEIKEDWICTNQEACMVKKFPASLSGFYVCFYMSVSLMHGWIFFLLLWNKRWRKKVRLLGCCGYLGFPHGSVVRNLPGDTIDVGLITGSGRSPGVGNGNPLQYSYLENSMNRGARQATVHGVVKSQTRLCD